mgnify:CR=1 FL=1
MNRTRKARVEWMVRPLSPSILNQISTIRIRQSLNGYVRMTYSIYPSNSY